MAQAVTKEAGISCLDSNPDFEHGGRTCRVSRQSYVRELRNCHERLDEPFRSTAQDPNSKGEPLHERPS